MRLHVYIRWQILPGAPWRDRFLIVSGKTVEQMEARIYPMVKGWIGMPAGPHAIECIIREAAVAKAAPDFPCVVCDVEPGGKLWGLLQQLRREEQR